MPFSGMPINTLHSIVIICTSYFPLMTFHMYSWAWVNVILLYSALITTFPALFLALTLSFMSHFLFPFSGWPPRRVKRKLLPNYRQEKEQKEPQLRNHNPVHSHILACTEDGAIFKCGEVDTDFCGLVIFFSTPTFYFFVCMFDCIFVWFFLNLVTTWLK